MTLPAIWNMSFGFFGIQFGWGLQMANMSAIYKDIANLTPQVMAQEIGVPFHKGAAKWYKEQGITVK